MGESWKEQTHHISRNWTVLAVLFVILLSSCEQTRTSPQAVGGVLDLSGWDFGQHGPVRMDGQWEFYWNEFLFPEDFEKTVLPKADEIHVPGLWSKAKNGYATYRLVIHGLSGDDRSALFISDVLSVCNGWIDGKKLISGGRVGTDKTSEVPQAHTLLAQFTPAGDPVEIILQVSNFHNVQGGINTPVWIGPNEPIHQMIIRMWTTTAVIGGLLLLMGIFHLLLYIMRRKAIANLYVGLFCMLWATQTLFGVSGGCLMAFLFPSLPWRLSIDLTLMAYGFTMPLMVMFYHVLFPNKYSRLINRCYQFLGGALVIYILATPPNAYDMIMLFFFLATLSEILYLFAMFIHDLIKKNHNVGFLIPGYIILAFTIINDMLLDMHFIKTVELIPFGTLAFILSYSILISVRTSRTLSRAEQLTTELQDKNVAISENLRLKKELDIRNKQGQDLKLLQHSPSSTRNAHPKKDEGLEDRGEDTMQDKRRLAVDIMNAACDLWTISTGKSKVELAEESGLWNVYIGRDGWARTQTLDKYLNLYTLPARPRWKVIVNTVNFVLAMCEEPVTVRQELEKSFEHLKVKI